jgi:hypothetical protein
MSQLMVGENCRGPSRPAETFYLCGVIDHRGVRSQEDADARVRSNAREFLTRHAEPVWPEGCDGDGSFDWEMLFDRNGAVGEARLEAQFFRANFQPTEATCPGEERRQPAAVRRVGVPNLKLAGTGRATDRRRQR